MLLINTFLFCPPYKWHVIFCLFFYLVKEYYIETENNTASIALFSTNQIADILYVSDKESCSHTSFFICPQLFFLLYSVGSFLRLSWNVKILSWKCPEILMKKRCEILIRHPEMFSANYIVRFLDQVSLKKKAQSAFTCSKLTIETLEEVVKYVQS